LRSKKSNIFYFCYQIYETLLMLLLVLIIIILPTQVFCRFVLNHSLTWPDEISPYILAWITFLGSFIALKTEQHASFDLMVNKLSGKVKYFFSLIKNLVISIFLFVLFYYSLPLVIVKWPDHIYTLPISKGFLYSAVSVGALLMLYISSFEVIKNIKNIFKKRERKEVEGSRMKL